MNTLKNNVVSMLLWSWGGTVYFLLEVVFKTITGHSERVSWTMLVVATLLTIVIERCGEQFPWECPLLAQALICTVVITLVELLSGIIINRVLLMNVWDYSNLPYNFLGQICLRYSALWFLLSLIFIPIFDWLRWVLDCGDKPRYCWR